MTWAGVLGGVLAGLIATGIWLLAVRTTEYVRLRRYAGSYSVSRKQKTERDDWKVMIGVKWRRRGLYVRFENLPPDDWVCGRILMDEQFRGAGRYRHMKGGE